MVSLGHNLLFMNVLIYNENHLNYQQSLEVSIFNFRFSDQLYQHSRRILESGSSLIKNQQSINVI